VACSRCGGRGRVGAPCRACGGEGRVRRAETIDVRIPAGMQTGSRVRVPGRGNAGTHGAPAGDLYIITQVEPHPYFERRGDDLYTVVPITVSEAALGAKIEVPTIDGRALLRIPAGTPSGQRFRLREKIEDLQGEVRQFVEFVNRELERMRDRSMQERFRTALVRVGPRVGQEAPPPEAEKAKAKAS